MKGLDQSDMHDKTVRLFDAQLTEWARLACEEWGFACPPSEFFEKVTARLPDGLRATLGFGLEEGLVIPQGHTFLLKGLAPGKGPYRWFRNRLSYNRERHCVGGRSCTNARLRMKTTPSLARARFAAS